jgi:hypothetical protein
MTPSRSTSLPVLSLVALALAVLLAVPEAEAQDRSNALPRVSPNAAVTQTIGVTEMQIAYGRPSVRDRTIFGDLVPYDEVWRTGANEATTISFSTPVQIEGESLDAGTYAFFTVPGQDEWTLIFNNEASQWGAYNYNEGADALRVTVEPQDMAATEMMSFSVPRVTDSTATVHLRWAGVGVPFQVSTDTDANIRRLAEDAASNPSTWQQPARYAGYALENGVMLEDALSWVQASVETEKTFQNTNLHARLLAANGRYDEAVTVAEDALSMAESMDEMPRGAEDLQSKMSEWENQ